MRSVPGIRYRDFCQDACLAQPPSDVSGHRGLATTQMVGSRGVYDETVRRIGRHYRRIAQRPRSQPVECLGIRVKIGVLHDELRNESLRLGPRHSNPSSGAASKELAIDKAFPVAAPAAVLSKMHQLVAGGARFSRSTMR